MSYNSDMYKMQTEGDIFSISENLWNIVQEEKVYHIQVLISRQIELIQRERESIYRRIHENYLKGISRHISRHTTTSDYW